MRVFYTDIFVLPLPEKHKFPMDKYRLTRERLLSEGILSSDELLVPPAADESTQAGAHRRLSRCRHIR